MPAIIVRDLTEEEYLKLLKKKREAKAKNWREFFLKIVD
jgi:hypothetical protein